MTSCRLVDDKDTTVGGVLGWNAKRGAAALAGLHPVSWAFGLVEDDGGYCASYTLDFQDLILQEVPEFLYACR